MEAINMAEAKSRFSELVSRAASGERILVRRRERTVAVLISPAELERLERAAQAAHRLAEALGQDEALLARIERGEVHPVMAAFGLWRDDPTLNELVGEVYHSRQNSPQRPDVNL
ncbi:MAG: type II toxin-antitoxin system Phd/YefM family antitoxin [Anaerolineales bacterium]|nr:type II toxin-antitoxin system Phd/YefM family antitoxin [Anaerolineales bacterium]